MPRAEAEKKTTRICVRIFSDDLDYLREVAETNSDLGYNLLIRQIVADYVMRLRDRERRALDQRPKSDLTNSVEIEL